MNSFFRLQNIFSRKFDSFLPGDITKDGGDDFIDRILPKYLNKGQKVYDVGGGKNPIISSARKSELNLDVVGIDIDANELSLAPLNSYSSVINADIQSLKGNNDGDLVICFTLLEHVKDAKKAFNSLKSLLKSDGKLLLFVPSKVAVFAQLNILLPERLKKKIISFFFKSNAHNQGFKAYYDKCTIIEYQEIAQELDLEVLEYKPYYHSAYFVYIFPIHLIWRLWILFFKAMRGKQAAETFSMVIQHKQNKI